MSRKNKFILGGVMCLGLLGVVGVFANTLGSGITPSPSNVRVNFGTCDIGQSEKVCIGGGDYVQIGSARSDCGDTATPQECIDHRAEVLEFPCKARDVATVCISPVETRSMYSSSGNEIPCDWSMPVGWNNWENIVISQSPSLWAATPRSTYCTFQKKAYSLICGEQTPCPSGYTFVANDKPCVLDSTYKYCEWGGYVKGSDLKQNGEICNANTDCASDKCELPDSPIETGLSNVTVTWDDFAENENVSYVEIWLENSDTGELFSPVRKINISEHETYFSGLEPGRVYEIFMRSVFENEGDLDYGREVNLEFTSKPCGSLSSKYQIPFTATLVDEDSIEIAVVPHRLPIASSMSTIHKDGNTYKTYIKSVRYDVSRNGSVIKTFWWHEDQSGQQHLDEAKFGSTLNTSGNYQMGVGGIVYTESVFPNGANGFTKKTRGGEDYFVWTDDGLASGQKYEYEITTLINYHEAKLDRITNSMIETDYMVGKLGGSMGSGDGSDGDLVVTSGTKIVNSVATSLSNSASVGDTFINVNSQNAFKVGDEIMIIQSQGGTTSNVGNYEFKRITSVTGQRFGLESGLSNFYDGKTQVLKIPNYKNVTVASGATLKPMPWNGSMGGILVFRASGVVDIRGKVDASEVGFRGGESDSSYCYENEKGYQTCTAYNGSGVTGGGDGSTRGGNGANAFSGGGYYYHYSGGGAGSFKISSPSPESTASKLYLGNGSTQGAGGGGAGGGKTRYNMSCPYYPGSAGYSSGTPGNGGYGICGGDYGCLYPMIGYPGTSGQSGKAGGGIVMIFAGKIQTYSYGSILANAGDGGIGGKGGSYGIYNYIDDMRGGAGQGGQGGKGGTVIIFADEPSLYPASVSADGGDGGLGGRNGHIDYGGIGGMFADGEGSEGTSGAAPNGSLGAMGGSGAGGPAGHGGTEMVVAGMEFSDGLLGKASAYTGFSEGVLCGNYHDQKICSPDIDPTQRCAEGATFTGYLTDGPDWQWQCERDGYVQTCNASFSENCLNCGDAQGGTFVGPNNLPSLCDDVAGENVSGFLEMPALENSWKWTWTCGLYDEESDAICNANFDYSVLKCGSDHMATVSSSDAINNKCEHVDQLPEEYQPASSEIQGSAPWTWTCNLFGKSVDCQADFSSSAGGGCGAANGDTTSTKPENSRLCGAGYVLAAEVELDGSFWYWTCKKGNTETACVASYGKDNGDGGGVDPNAPRCGNVDTIDLDYGAEFNKSGDEDFKQYRQPNGGVITTAPSAVLHDLCAVGTVVDSRVFGKGPWVWLCKNGERTVACSSNDIPENDDFSSLCGEANGGKFQAKLEEGLCNPEYVDASGISPVIGDGPWTWTCTKSWRTSVCMAGTGTDSISIIGQSRSDSLSGFGDTAESSIGSVQLKEFSQTINRNIISLIRNAVDYSSGTASMSSTGHVSGATRLYNNQVYYIKNRNLIINNNVTFDSADPVTYVIDGGDLIINANLGYKNGSSVGFIVLHESGQDGGNVYIDPSVTEVVGSYYLEGSLMSAKDSSGNNKIEDSEIYDGFNSNEELKDLKNQLYFQGILISRNTIYGSTLDPKNANDIYRLPFGVVESDAYVNFPDNIPPATFKDNQANCHDDNGVCEDLRAAAQRFDVSKIRQFKPYSGGEYSPSILQLKDANKINSAIYSKSFILRYDGLVYSATPLGFEDK